MKGARGLDYLSYLLQRPYQDVPALELRAAISPGSSVGRGSTGFGATLDESLSTSGFRDAGEVLDQQAIEEYKDAVLNLKEDLEEAEELNNSDRAAHLREQIKLFEHELLKAHGLGGRIRKAGDIPDRARKAISSALNRSLSKISSEDPSLGRHLRNSINMGRTCSYSPDSLTNWDH